jgi:hypothetical protein
MSKHRRDNSIKKSLHEIKKTLKSNNWDGKSKRNMECKANSLNSFKFENPMCDSNKTKATCADSPAQTFPVEVEMVLSVYDNQLSKFEKIELSDYKQKNPHFKIYFLGDISTRKKNPDIGIFSYDIPSGELTLINKIQTSVFGETIRDFTVEVVLSKDELILYSYSDDFGEKLYTLNKESLKPLISSNFEIVDIEFR